MMTDANDASEIGDKQQYSEKYVNCFPITKSYRYSEKFFDFEKCDKVTSYF